MFCDSLRQKISGIWDTVLCYAASEEKLVELLHHSPTPKPSPTKVVEVPDSGQTQQLNLQVPLKSSSVLCACPSSAKENDDSVCCDALTCRHFCWKYALSIFIVVVFLMAVMTRLYKQVCGRHASRRPRRSRC